MDVLLHICEEWMSITNIHLQRAFANSSGNIAIVTSAFSPETENSSS